MKKKIIIKVFSAFAGFDTQFLALRQYAKWYNQHTNGPLVEFKLVGWCEIDEDAIVSHNALFPEAKRCHYPDITKVAWERVPDFDVLIYSSCCQSLTRAGAQKGMTEGSGTPSSLIWYIRPAIETKRPKVCILENVPPLLETKFEGEFEKWRNAVSRCGYRNTWSTMCAADFGVPQNRKRVFLVSVRNDIKKNIYFHEPVGCTIQAEEHLEETVDEKYYLSEDDAAAFVLNLADKATADFDMPHIYNKGRCVKKIITPSCQEYNIHVCPTLVADKNYGKTNYKKMLSTTHFPRTGVLEIWHTSEQVIIPYKKQIEEALVDTERKFKIINASRKDIIKQINKMGPGDYFRLRRLTPREWFRFMSVEEKDIDRLVSTGVSESQLYKQGGNAIVIKTMRYLYTSIFDDVSEWYRC
jgi:DNA (cytosine-5)-methyltransferase 1